MGHYHQGSSQDIQRGVLVSVQYQATVGADVGPHGERFLDPLAAARTILRRVAWRDGYHGNAVQRAIVPDPGEEEAPTGIADAL